MITTSVSHTFSAAHRLPHLRGKCANLHGHNWQVEVTIGADQLTPGAVVVDFDAIKTPMRAWIDEHLDHATLLGAGDDLAPVLDAYGQKLYVFGPGGHWPPQEWPTVEAVALLLADKAHGWLIHDAGAPPGVRLLQVTVRETDHNTATWAPTPPAVREGDHQ